MQVIDNAIPGRNLYGAPPTRAFYSARPIDIEQLLVWAFRDQKAHKVLEARDGLFDQEAALDGHAFQSSRDSSAMMERNGQLGTRVDGGGRSAPHLHDDAEEVYKAVMALTVDEAMLVRKHACAASRPDHEAVVPPKAFPVPNRLGNPTVCYPSDKNRDPGHGWCLVQWTVSPVSAEVIRIEYAIWHKALKLLAVALAHAGRLIDHRPKMPSAPARPTIRTMDA